MSARREGDDDASLDLPSRRMRHGRRAGGENRGETVDFRVVVTERVGHVTVVARGPEGLATVVVDLSTHETVTDVRGALSERGLLVRLANAAVNDRVRGHAHDHTRRVHRMNPTDVQTWTPMQILAGTTGASWSLPAEFGGSAAEDRRVNRAFIETVWGI